MCIDTYMYALLKIQYYIKRSLVGGGLCFDTCASLNDIDTLCGGRGFCFDTCAVFIEIDTL